MPAYPCIPTLLGPDLIAHLITKSRKIARIPARLFQGQENTTITVSGNVTLPALQCGVEGLGCAIMKAQ